MPQTENAFRLPGLSDRVGVVGRTGTGKTRFGMWLLSEAPFDQVPYVVIDYKSEELFTQSDRIKEIGFGEVPKYPGVYILRPGTEPEDDLAVEAWLRRVHRRENCGLYVDEGYGINRNSPGLRAVLTQGRSKHLPTIFLSQRPAWISPYVVSEASYMAVFPLTKPEDQKRVREIVPGDPFERLASMPPFHSYWFDVGRNIGFNMHPVPGDDVILSRLDERLRPKKRGL